MSKNSAKGCRGRRIKIIPEKSTILGQEDQILQKGMVTGVGPESKLKVGDVVIFSTDGYDRVELSPGEYVYYVLDTDQFVYEVL